jgi:hypothetical protein
MTDLKFAIDVGRSAAIRASFHGRSPAGFLSRGGEILGQKLGSSLDRLLSPRLVSSWSQFSTKPISLCTFLATMRTS